MARFSVAIQEGTCSSNSTTGTVKVDITSLDDWKGTVTMTYTLSNCTGGSIVFLDNQQTTLVREIYMPRNYTKTDEVAIETSDSDSVSCTLTASGEAFGEVHVDSCSAQLNHGA